MMRFKQAGPPILLVALVAGVVGYVLGCSQSEMESSAKAREQDTASKGDGTGPNNASGAPSNAPQSLFSVAKAISNREMYNPGSEDLAPDGMRVVACGTGKPNARPK